MKTVIKLGCETKTPLRRPVEPEMYRAIGIPRSMFTVMFAIARTVGWVAHWQEMVSESPMRIGRPRQLYTGALRRDYAAIANRK